MTDTRKPPPGYTSWLDLLVAPHGEGDRKYLALARAELKQLRERVDNLRNQRNDAQDRVIRYWSRCPKCGGLAPMTGMPCVVGNCWMCDHVIIESEMDDVEPREYVKGLRTQRDRLVYRLTEVLESV